MCKFVKSEDHREKTRESYDKFTFIHGKTKFLPDSPEVTYCNSTSLTCMYDTSTAGAIDTRAAARKSDNKSGARPLVF